MSVSGSIIQENEMLNELKKIFEDIKDLPIDERVDVINGIYETIADIGPFTNEPVSFVRWVKADEVYANDYNPNSVAPPEMELLKLSVLADGYTQPIVTWINNGKYEVVDGFHRNRVGKEVEEVKERLHGYLPVVVIKDSQIGRGDRIASTIRHNRARGKHKVDAMSDIVLELRRRNWSNKKIAKQLGMDQDEVLRLTQITGLAEMFADTDFSEAWEAESLEDIEYDKEAIG